jgi:hypothetical protein
MFRGTAFQAVLSFSRTHGQDAEATGCLQPFAEQIDAGDVQAHRLRGANRRRPFFGGQPHALGGAAAVQV